MTQQEMNQAQEERHQLMIIRDFGELVLALGPNVVLRQLPFDAQDEISMAIDSVMLERGSSELLRLSKEINNV